MSTYKVTDEQLQAIRKELADDRAPDCDGVWYWLGEIKAMAKLLVIAVEERDSRITALEAKCALHAASEAQALRQQDRLQLLVESMEEWICIDDGQDFEDRAEELLVMEVREEYHLVEIDNLKAQLADLRKPVEVERNERVEVIRRERIDGSILLEDLRLADDRRRNYLLLDHTWRTAWEFKLVFDAYDTLAQDQRANSAHDVHMAEIAGLRDILAQERRFKREWVDKAFAAGERERQLREALQFPREPDKSLGWTVAYDFIESIHDVIKGQDFGPGYECIELVLLEVEKRAALAQPQEHGGQTRLSEPQCRHQSEVTGARCSLERHHDGDHEYEDDPND